MNIQNRKTTALVVLVLVLGLTLSSPVFAQVSGATLSGLVTDAQGGAVAGAKVSIKNVSTGIGTETTTNDAGAYSVPNLNAGDYEISFTATGFKTAVAKATLIVGAKQAINVSMAVGEVTQNVEVSAVAPQ